MTRQDRLQSAYAKRESLTSMAATNVESLLVSKGTLKGARPVYVYFISTHRNEWVDWNGNTDTVQRIWRSPFPSVEAAQRAAETGRTSGSTFYIRHSVALCLEFDIGLALIYQSDLQPLRFLNKVLDECVGSQKIFPKLLVAVRDSTSRFLYQQAYVAKDAPSLVEFKEGEMLYSRRASGSGNKRNGLAWTLTPEPIIPDTVLRLVGKIESLLMASADNASADEKDILVTNSTSLSRAEAEAAEKAKHTQEEAGEPALREPQNPTEVEISQLPEPPVTVEPPDKPTEATVREQLTLARLGQGMFRERLEAIEPGCRLTGLANKTHLRASHIKPWRDASDAERLDGNNGLLLSPHVDHLFDQGYISFSDDGTVLLSPSLDREVLAAWHLTHQRLHRPLNEAQKNYMAYHRASIFKTA